MKIIIDLRPLETGNRYRGFGYYIYNLMAELPKLDTKHTYFCLMCSKENMAFPHIKDAPNFKPVFLPYPNWRPRLNWLYDHFILPAKLIRFPANIYISLDYNLPLLLKIFKPFTKTIVTAHDLIPYILWDEYDFAIDRNLLYRLQFFSARHSTELMTISHASKKDIVRMMKVPANKVHPIHLAVDENYHCVEKSESDKVMAKYKVDFPYILSVGEYLGVDPRKNYDLILDVLDRVIKEDPKTKLKVLYVGRQGGKNNEYEKIIKKMKELKLEDRVVFAGFAAEEDMPSLYTRAEVFMYPTRYEGFGLPILQAQACGCPVVTSDNSSLPEVGGDAAILCKTGDINNFVDAVRLAINNRKEISEKGIKNAKKFTWRKTAEQTLDVINGLK